MYNFADRGGCYPPWLEAEVDSILQDLHNSLHQTKSKFSDIALLFTRTCNSYKKAPSSSPALAASWICSWYS